jgi:hypothetical protein
MDGTIGSRTNLLPERTVMPICWCNNTERIRRMPGLYAKLRNDPIEVVKGEEILGFKESASMGFDVGEGDLDRERL